LDSPAANRCIGGRNRKKACTNLPSLLARIVFSIDSYSYERFHLALTKYGYHCSRRIPLWPSRKLAHRTRSARLYQNCPSGTPYERRSSHRQIFNDSILTFHIQKQRRINKPNEVFGNNVIIFFVVNYVRTGPQPIGWTWFCFVSRVAKHLPLRPFCRCSVCVVMSLTCSYYTLHR